MLMFTGVQQLLTGCLLNFSAWMEMFAQAQAWIFHECMPACICVCLEARTKVDVCPTHPSPLFFSEGERLGGGGEIQIGMIYSFRPLPLMKGCRWMTYHLTVDTIITPMSKKTIKLWCTWICAHNDSLLELWTWNLNLKALYKYTDRLLTIFSLVDASSRLNQKRLGNL